MSWSVHAVGKPAAVKAALAKQSEGAKNGTSGIPEEQACVAACETGVNAQLDFADANGVGAVKVFAAGSNCKSSGSYVGSAVFSVTFETLYGFVE